MNIYIVTEKSSDPIVLGIFTSREDAIAKANQYGSDLFHVKQWNTETQLHDWIM